MTERVRVLAVDDDPMILELLQRGLEPMGFVVQTVPGPSEARKALERSAPPDLVLVDANIPGVSGNDLAAFAAACAPVRLVLLSADDPASLRRLASRIGAHGWLSKSAPLDELGKQLLALHRRPRAGPSGSPEREPK